MTPHIALIDYGMGNMHSVEKALQKCGAHVSRVSHADSLPDANAIVLPGVGHFGDGMAQLERRGFIPILKEWAKNDNPFLGICLGMQMMLEKSEEAPGTPGLGFCPGKVIRFAPATNDIKVPHMGWNSLNIKNDCPLFSSIPPHSFVYFVHSYYVQTDDNHWCAATTSYDLTFCATLHSGSLFGTQFHPEKSQSVGLKILSNFVSLSTSR